MAYGYHTLQHWNQWLSQQFLGNSLLQAEEQILARLLAKHYGKHAVLIGVPQQFELLKSIHLPCQSLLTSLLPRETKAHCIEGDFHELPLMTGSIDLVVLPHTLELVDNPRQLLSEACRIIKPEGLIAICGFNPYSTWGVRKLLAKKKTVPWSGNFLQSHKIKSWLRLADFEMEKQQSALFRPPVKQSGFYQKMHFLETIGSKCFPVLGGVYVLLHLMLLCVSGTMIISFASSSVEGIQVYQKNVPLSPEHKQKLADDITRYRNADNLWDVLREDFTLPHYEDSPAVQSKIEWYMNNQDYLLRSASRAAPYLYYILQQVKKRHLPAELVLLPIVESGYNPFSQSIVGATGIWQLMPDTASGLGIKHDSWYDGRRDVIASTRAALNYLAYLQSFFEGNWLLAMAAYNTGEGNIQSAIRRNIRDGRDTDFWSLPVAQETKDYVPSLLALAVIISHPDQYPIYFPPVRNAPYLAQVDVGTQINLEYAATLAGISFKKLKQLNPGFSRPSTSRKGPYKLVLPIENVEQFTENLSRTPLNRKINWFHYKVKTGDTLVSIAKKFTTTVAEIRKLNHLSKTLLHHGANLLIPKNGEVEIAEEDSDDSLPDSEVSKKSGVMMAEKTKTTAQQAPALSSLEAGVSGSYTLQPGDTIYMVRSKDSLTSIARRFHVDSRKLMQANGLSSHTIKPGKQLVIPTHAAATVASASRGKSISPGDTVYMVRHGDTIEKIAQKFHLTPASIRLTNLVDNDSLSDGESLIIPTHMRS